MSGCQWLAEQGATASRDKSGKEGSLHRKTSLSSPQKPSPLQSFKSVPAGVAAGLIEPQKAPGAATGSARPPPSPRAAAALAASSKAAAAAPAAAAAKVANAAAGAAVAAGRVAPAAGKPAGAPAPAKAALADAHAAALKVCLLASVPLPLLLASLDSAHI